MKLLILTDGIFPFVVGGMQRHSHYLTKFMVLRGHDVTLIHCVTGNAKLPDHSEVCSALGVKEDQLKTIGLRFPSLGFLPGHYLNESYQYSRAAYERIKNELSSFDFVYAKGFSAWHFLALKSKGTAMPPIGVKFHGYEMFQPPASFKARLQHWLLQSPVKWNNKHADVVFSYGGKITTVIRNLGVSPDRIITAPTGIERGWLVPQVRSSQGIRKFLFLGRYERRKGVEELSAALLKLAGKEEFEFHFIGPIPPSKRIVSDQLIYHGQITEASQMQAIMDECDVLVVPSHSEGMPNVIMEGMARGLAVLATDVGAVAELIDESSGWLIGAGSAEVIESVLKRIIGLDRSELNRIKHGARERVERFFTWEMVSEHIEQEIIARI